MNKIAKNTLSISPMAAAVIGGVVADQFVGTPTMFHAIFWPGLCLVMFAWIVIFMPKTENTQNTRMPTREEAEAFADQLTEGLSIESAFLDRVNEAAQGYRQKLEQMGYSPTVAEQLAGAYHISLLKRLDR